MTPFHRKDIFLWFLLPFLIHALIVNIEMTESATICLFSFITPVYCLVFCLKILHLIYVLCLTCYSWFVCPLVFTPGPCLDCSVCYESPPDPLVVGSSLDLLKPYKLQLSRSAIHIEKKELKIPMVWPTFSLLQNVFTWYNGQDIFAFINIIWFLQVQLYL